MDKQEPPMYFCVWMIPSPFPSSHNKTILLSRVQKIIDHKNLAGFLQRSAKALSQPTGDKVKHINILYAERERASITCECITLTTHSFSALRPLGETGNDQAISYREPRLPQPCM